MLPAEASTLGLVKELTALNQLGPGSRVLAPVPRVGGGLMEPAAVPSFLAALEAAGAEAVSQRSLFVGLLINCMVMRVVGPEICFLAFWICSLNARATSNQSTARRRCAAGLPPR